MGKKKIMFLPVLLAMAVNTFSDLINFTIPFKSDLYFSFVSGSSAARTDFGLEVYDGVRVAYLVDLNSPEETPPGHDVFAGSFLMGDQLTFFQRSMWHNGIHYVYSDVENTASLNSFTDVNNSLGLGGSIVEQTSDYTWLLHLDDAAPFFDDDDNDIVVQIRLVSKHPSKVPEPNSMLLLLAGFVFLMGGWLHRSTKKY